MPVWGGERISVVSDEDLLVEGTVYYAAVLQRGDTIHYSAKAKSPVSLRIANAQSCNGRIPVNGSPKIYLSFLNERMRFTNYIWVEASAVVPVTEYYTYTYSLRNYREGD